MKRLKSFFLFIFISAFFLSLNNYVLGQLTEEQIGVFRSVKTVKIILDQTYKEAENVTLPFNEVAQRLLGYAGLKVVNPSAKNFDLKMKIEAKGQASSASYQKLGSRYTGASVSGWISLEVQGVPVYRKAFKGVQETAKVMLQGESSVIRISEYKTPSSAPFKSAFDKPGSFVSKMLLVIGEIYGTNPIMAALRDQENIVRNEAQRILVELNDARAIEPLIASLRDEDWNVRKNAVSALSRIGGSRAVEPLIAALRDKYSEVREAAVRALGRIEDKRAVEPLINALKDKSREIREASAEALRKIKDRRAVEPLIAALNDKDSSVRQEAAIALGEINDNRAVKPLIAAQKDENSHVRSSVAKALDKLGWSPEDDRQRAIHLIDRGFWNESIKIGEPAVEPLIVALKDKSDYVRRNAAKALGKIKDKSAVEPLIAVLKDKNEYSRVREEVVKALGEINDSRAVEPLIAALRDSDYNMPMYAAEELGNLKDKRAVEPLILALKHERDMVRSYAAKALGKIKDKRAVEPLIALLGDKFRMVRSYTARALGNITGESFGISQSQWKEWWEENKSKYIKK